MNGFSVFSIRGCVHITGGGVRNDTRYKSKLSVEDCSFFFSCFFFFLFEEVGGDGGIYLVQDMMSMIIDCALSIYTRLV